FLNANPGALIKGNNSYPQYSNYFIGNDPGKWVSNVLSYNGVTYTGLWTNIDMKVYSNFNNVKYELIVKPGASTNIIRLNYEGADQLKIKNDNLVITTSVGEVIEQKPYAYQIVNNKKKEVLCSYRLTDKVFSFYFPKGYNK